MTAAEERALAIDSPRRCAKYDGLHAADEEKCLGCIVEAIEAAEDAALERAAALVEGQFYMSDFRLQDADGPGLMAAKIRALKAQQLPKKEG